MQGNTINGVNSYTAAAALSEGTIVKFSGSTDANGLPTVTPTTAATDAAIGVAIRGCASGEKCAIAIFGVFNGSALVLSAGAVTVGAQLTAVGAATTGDSDVIIGRALSAASGEGVLVEVAHQVGQVK
ncbi:MAG: DUF2190 family protein [Kiritimatiellae bacterium]|nr:DUF2190 family protein [Kiritimatiellia bacterium]